jgi:hypothetical protein
MNQSAWSIAPRGELSREDLRRAVIAGIENALGVTNQISTSGLMFDKHYGRAGQLISVNGQCAVQIFAATDAHPTGMYVMGEQKFGPTKDAMAVARQVAETLRAEFPREESRKRRSNTLGDLVDSYALFDTSYRVADRALRKFARQTYNTDAPTPAQKRLLALTLSEKLKEIALQLPEDTD